MSCILVLNGLFATPYLRKKMTNEKDSLEILLEKIIKFSNIEKRIFIANNKEIELPSNLETILIPDARFVSFLQAIKKISADYENIVHIFADTPFIDHELCEKLIRLHMDEMADYTYAEGFVGGVACEVMKSDMPEKLLSLIKNEKAVIKRNSIFETICKDINSFDIETIIAEEDQSLLRLFLCTEKKRDYTLLKKIFESNAESFNAGEMGNFLRSNIGLTRTLPVFFQMEITTHCQLSCPFCPRTKVKPEPLHMPFKSYQLICKKIKDFCDDAVILFSGLGEPTLNPDFLQFLKCNQEHNFTSIVETNGLTCTDFLYSEISKLQYAGLYFVFSIDSLDGKIFQSLRTEKAGFQSIYQNYLNFHEKLPDTTYVQAVRMQENEDVLPDFFRTLKKETENIIIKKYNTFAGFLPEKKVANITPLERFPCWHLKRDLAIQVNGNVSLCFVDLNNTNSIGNILDDPLEILWEKIGFFYDEHCQDKYSGICKNCDEFYTYNF